jgi:hypothetical protein
LIVVTLYSNINKNQERQQEQVREEANSHANGLPKNLIVYTRAGTQKDGVSEACSSDNL